MVIKRQCPQLDRVEVGMRVHIRRLVRVGSDSWYAEVTGIVRRIEPVPTGVHTQRRPQDDLWVETITVEKPNGELSTVVVDEHTKIEPVQE